MHYLVEEKKIFLLSYFSGFQLYVHTYVLELCKTVHKNLFDNFCQFFVNFFIFPISDRFLKSNKNLKLLYDNEKFHNVNAALVLLGDHGWCIDRVW